MHSVAEALQHSHERGLVHRDIKPANILIEQLGGNPHAYVADFGLAMRQEDYGKGSNFAGTVAYMSPEQARGESHLVDGRSDIFSLGVVFYEILTGELPFAGSSWQQVADQIVLSDPISLREHDPGISAELERICLKALAKRMADRYQSAVEMATDILHVLQPEAAGIAEKVVVPKGLKCFDASDADFFPELLPGPRDAEGVPESIRSLARRIENSDVRELFRVGLIYGPSGCGKSSFVRAGLLPRLSDNVVTSFLEASATGTEERILVAIQRHCPGIEPGRTLSEVMGDVRKGVGLAADRKILIVIDQFEQWLHANQEQHDTELHNALQMCDGQHVQCLLLVRDDFWMAVTRLLHATDISLADGENCFAVDAFDIRHAKKVLTELGRAYGNLPQHPTPPTKGQNQFLDEAVAGLAQQNGIIPVRLAVFTEAIKEHTWNSDTLKRIGGMDGLGRVFLDEAFARFASAQRSEFETAARRVLKRLLPEQRLSIRGHKRTAAELLDASGFRETPEKFEQLLSVLVNDLRLIVASQSAHRAGQHSHGTELSYQLTHDFLVRPLWTWLTDRQQSSWRGRAELWLSEQAMFWNAKRTSRHLPSMWEWVAIVCLTRKKEWNALQRGVMNAANVYYLKRLAIAACLLLVIAAVWSFNRRPLRGSANAGQPRKDGTGNFDGTREYSDWLEQSEYQSLFAKMNKLGKYPARVEGRFEGKEARFRAKFELDPKDATGWFSYSHMSSDLFYWRKQALRRRGYTLTQLHKYENSEKKTFYAATWIRKKSNRRKIRVPKIGIIAPLVGNDFVLAQRVPWTDTERMVAEIRDTGLRPLRIRCYRSENRVLAAMILTRDDLPWQITIGSNDQIQNSHREFARQGYHPIDLCGFSDESVNSASGELVSVCTWVKPEEPIQRQFSITLGRTERIWSEQYSAGWRPLSRQLFRDAGMNTHHNLIWWKSTSAISSWRGDLEFYEKKIVSEKENCQIDVTIQSGKTKADLRYGGIWVGGLSMTSIELHGLHPREHVVKCKRLMSQGYYPVAIDGASTSDGSVYMASVWHK